MGSDQTAQNAALAVSLVDQGVPLSVVASKLGCSRSWAQSLYRKGIIAAHRSKLEASLREHLTEGKPVTGMHLGSLGLDYRAYWAIRDHIKDREPSVRDALDLYLLWARLPDHETPRGIGRVTLAHLRDRLQAAHLLSKHSCPKCGFVSENL